VFFYGLENFEFCTLSQSVLLSRLTMFSDQYNSPASRNEQPGASRPRTQRQDAPVVTQSSRQCEIRVKQFAIVLN